ncbi:unnamed protein product [Allacma fusca]|uniref:Chitin-binding type-2 domain-containing protein n=1 Tax=Allacma fusca TaxID=39272 RepID=A0A8J2KT79_9HEXA|nr:unnamed protein product [Allacma fusca]
MRTFKLTPILAALPLILGLVVAEKAAGDAVVIVPAPDDVCNPMECRQKGDCFHYQVCYEGAWKNETCNAGLFWNSQLPNNFGGACDYWSNLPDDIKNDYSTDPNCVPPCRWWQQSTELCSPYYHFTIPFDPNHPLTASQRDTILKCPSAPAGSSEPDLIWNPAKFTCDKPSNVNNCANIIAPDAPVSI